jgi:hypothetical protein
MIQTVILTQKSPQGNAWGNIERKIRTRNSAFVRRPRSSNTVRGDAASKILPEVFPATPEDPSPIRESFA